MARAKRIYILIIKVNKLFSFFSSYCFLKEIENMYSVFLSSYRNPCESLGELEIAVETLACGSCSHNLQSGVLFFVAGRNAWYNYFTIRLPPPNWKNCQREFRRCHWIMNQSELPEVASWAGITQGTKSMNLHTVLYSTAEQKMVNFLKRMFL